MAGMALLPVVAFLAVSALAQTPQLTCDCDHNRPETLKQRACSLCNEAEKHTEEVFFLKDINPRKPNRWLALPRKHSDGKHLLHDMNPAERTALWKAAIAKAKEMWGPDDWGLAYNGPDVRTQCHAHLHIGKFARASENLRHVRIVSSPEEIPAPKDSGIWVHPHGGRLHVHLGEQITETVLLR